MATAPAFAAQHYGQDKGVQGQTDLTGSRTTTGQTTTPGASQEPVTPHRISKIVGENVENVKGESLGEIKDIVVEPNGAIAVSSGVLGVGDDPHPVPWKALRWSEKRDDFVLDIDKEAFKRHRVLLRTTGQWSLAQHGVISTGNMASVRASGCRMGARVPVREAERLINRG